MNDVLGQQQANLATAAEANARDGIADANALTTIWWAKHHYNLLRPVTTSIG